MGCLRTESKVSQEVTASSLQLALTDSQKRGPWPNRVSQCEGREPKHRASTDTRSTSEAQDLVLTEPAVQSANLTLVKAVGQGIDLLLFTAFGRGRAC